MATFKDLDQKTHVYGVMTYADITTTATGTAYVDMQKYSSVQFLLGIGTNDTSGAISMEQCTQATSAGTEAGLGFHYRKSGSVTDDTMGAITYVNSDSSAAYEAADDDKYFLVEPDQLADGYRWCRLVVTPSGTASATPVWCVAILKGPRYPQNQEFAAS